MKTTYKALIAAIVLIADIVCMFLFANHYNVVFWISLLFSVIAVVFAAGVIIFLAPKEKRVFGMNITAYAMAYLVAAIGTSFRYVFLPDVLAKKVAFIHVVIFAVFLVVVIMGKAENEFIDAQQEKRGKELFNFRFTLESMKSAMNKVPYNAPYKKKVEHAYDSLASGQTATIPEIEDLEKDILDAITLLDDVISSGDEAAIVEACDSIEKLAAERKHKLANKANF